MNRRRENLTQEERDFVGYSNTSKGYRIWMPDERRVDIARDVRFIGLSKTSSKTEDFDKISIDEDDDQSQIEAIFPLRSPHDHDPSEEIDNQIDYDSDRNEEEDAQVEPDPQQRGRGRPKIMRTGLRGRPRKQYHTENYTNETEETAHLAEISLEQAVHAEEWFQAIVSEMRSIVKNDTWTIINR